MNSRLSGQTISSDDVSEEKRKRRMEREQQREEQRRKREERRKEREKQKAIKLRKQSSGMHTHASCCFICFGIVITFLKFKIDCC